MNRFEEFQTERSMTDKVAAAFFELTPEEWAALKTKEKLSRLERYACFGAAYVYGEAVRADRQSDPVDIQGL